MGFTVDQEIARFYHDKHALSVIKRARGGLASACYEMSYRKLTKISLYIREKDLQSTISLLKFLSKTS